jgi:hypothetical protein
MPWRSQAKGRWVAAARGCQQQVITTTTIIIIIIII